MPKSGGPQYHGLILSPNMTMTIEGYLICKNVPLCRSGYQEYLGKELKGFDGYEESWGLSPEERYKVFRPKDEVLAQDFIDSLEGKTVVDEHPDGNVVHVDNDGEVNCGHVERVGEGDIVDGEVTLKGDLVIKDPDLIGKIRPEGDPDNEKGMATRDVSVGYGLKLKRLDDGTIVMVQLRGNHVAVVEKGRAGPRIAIRDSAPPEIRKFKEPIMSIRTTIIGRGIEAVFGTLSDAEKTSLMTELEAEHGGKKIAADAAVDAEDAKDASDVDAEPTPEHPAHTALDGCLDAISKGDQEALAAHKAELFKHIGHKDKEDEEEDQHKPEDLEELEEDSAIDAEDAEDAVDALDAEEEEEFHHKPRRKEDEDEDEDDEEGDEMNAGDSEDPADNPGESVLKAANDSVLDYIKKSRPLVAAITAKPVKDRSELEKVMVDSYNSTVKAINKTKKNSPYVIMSKVKVPDAIPTLAADSAAVTKTEDLSCTCFDGVPYRVGLKNHQAHLASKESK